jgi:hypothetical protein
MQRVKHAWYYGFFFLQTFSFFSIFTWTNLTLWLWFRMSGKEINFDPGLLSLFQSGVLMSYAVEEGIINNVSIYVSDQLWRSKWCSGVSTDWILDNSRFFAGFCRFFRGFFENFEGFFEDFRAMLKQKHKKKTYSGPVP